MADFESMWAAAAPQEDAPAAADAAIDESTPEYQIRDGIAYYLSVCTFFSVVYHEGFGEPMEEIFDTQDHIAIDAKASTEFHL